MSNDKRLAYLNDIVSATGLIEEFCSGKTVEVYKADSLLRSAVERQLTIVGEAVTKLLQLDCAMERSISSARKIVGFRNQLIHNYGSIDSDVVWTVIVQDLATLRRECVVLMERSSR